MPDYSKGKIYAIRAPGTEEVYIGSTTLSLAQRLSGHRQYISKGKYCSSSRILSKEGAYIELLEDFPCERREQLNKREGELIRANPTAVNRCIAGRTSEEGQAEYYKLHREERLEAAKKWYESNREKKQLYDKQRYEARKTRADL